MIGGNIDATNAILIIKTQCVCNSACSFCSTKSTTLCIIMMSGTTSHFTSTTLPLTPPSREKKSCQDNLMHYDVEY